MTETTKNFANGQVEVKTNIASNPTEFHTMVGKAQMSDDRVVEVTEELFNFLLNGQKSDYIMHGNPAVRVYKVGTRDQIEYRESLSLDELMKLRAKEAQEKAEKRV